MLATLTGPTPAQWQTSFDKALDRFKSRYTPIPYSRTCAVCAHPIFSADTTATEQGGEWTHAGCEPVISGAETNGDDSHDPNDTPPTEQFLNELYLMATGWEPVEQSISTEPIWRDPISGETFITEIALDRQSERDASGWSFTE